MSCWPDWRVHKKAASSGTFELFRRLGAPVVRKNSALPAFMCSPREGHNANPLRL
jgi:hypothetical protein